MHLTLLLGKSVHLNPFIPKDREELNDSESQNLREADSASSQSSLDHSHVYSHRIYFKQLPLWCAGQGPFCSSRGKNGSLQNRTRINENEGFVTLWVSTEKQGPEISDHLSRAEFYFCTCKERTLQCLIRHLHTLSHLILCSQQPSDRDLLTPFYRWVSHKSERWNK